MYFPDLPHLKQLQKSLWSWPKARASVMIGAGFSINSTPLPGVHTRFPTWRQLVRIMFDQLYPVGRNETNEQLKLREDRFNNSNALRIASQYEAAFGRQKLNILIREQNPDTDHQPGKLHNLLMQLPWADVFTTNYDTLLERTEIPERTYQPVTKADELTSAFAPRIVKLHGSFPSQDPFIITEEDYRRYPIDFAPFVNSVQQSLLENAFVLIGFSGDDPNFLEWTGWIRDQLARNHAPVYLVGPLGIGNAERTLLSKRGVTPIDLSPVFEEIQTANGIYESSLEWFLKNLLAAKPARPERWPQVNRNSVFHNVSLPPLIEFGEIVPPESNFFPHEQITDRLVTKLLTRWAFERQKYPGWLVAGKDKRQELWDNTQHWIIPLTSFVIKWPLPDRILVFREINWRLEAAMVPLFNDWVIPFKQAILDFSDLISNGGDVKITTEALHTLRVSKSEIVTAWFEIAFGLLREARETYNREEWALYKEKLNKAVQLHPQFSDRNYYEAALWSFWNVEREQAKAILSEWQPSSHSPLAAMRKAGLLAELDDLGEARTILRAALQAIRRALRNQGENIELLSLEGWCTFLIFHIETSFNFSINNTLREEFWERWHELKSWDCSPWPHKEYFKEALATPPIRIKELEERQGFDPGNKNTTLHYDGKGIDSYLPGFACIRMYEQVGIPMRLRHVDTSGESLQKACLWIAPFISFWSPALLIRAGRSKALVDGDFLNRPQVARMELQLAKRLYAWCLQILERELAQLKGSISWDSSQESILEVLPVVLSKLAFKVEPDDLRKTFPLVLQFHRQSNVKSHIRLHESCRPWFRRLFEAAEIELLLEWLPDLIHAPLFDEEIKSPIPAGYVWPDPMNHFPSERGNQVNESHATLLKEISTSVDWLLIRAASESGEGRHRAISRLIDVYQAKLMSNIQTSTLGELLWKQLAPSELPDYANFAAFGFMHLPAPPGIDVQSKVKKYILSHKVDRMVSEDGTGKISMTHKWGEQAFIFEAASASKPVFQFSDETVGLVDWSVEESKSLYQKALEWWDNDKKAFSFSTFRRDFHSPIHNTLERFGVFFARIVLPRMERATEEDWQKLLMLFESFRELDVYPTSALPYVLLHRPEESSRILKIIVCDLDSDNGRAIPEASKAARHWVCLGNMGILKEPDPSLVFALVQRVAFRRQARIEFCLHHLSHIVAEFPNVINSVHADLLTTSLIPWHRATVLSSGSGEAGQFKDVEKPDLRVGVARLAGALFLRHGKLTPNEPVPEPLAFWRESCSKDCLPEIRRAFASWEKS